LLLAARQLATAGNWHGVVLNVDRLSRAASIRSSGANASEAEAPNRQDATRPGAAEYSGKAGEPLARTPIETDSRQVHRFLSRYSAAGLRRKHPKIETIISDTIAQQLPRKLACDTLRCILQSCPVISTPAAAEATGYRYARSTIAEYAMLARVASKAIENYLAKQARALHTPKASAA
jgi:hypothetical protein